MSCSAWDGIRQASDLHAELQAIRTEQQAMSSKLDAITTEQQTNRRKLDTTIQTGLSLINSLAAIQSAASPKARKRWGFRRKL